MNISKVYLLYRGDTSGQNVLIDIYLNKDSAIKKAESEIKNFEVPSNWVREKDYWDNGFNYFVIESRKVQN